MVAKSEVNVGPGGELIRGWAGVCADVGRSSPDLARRTCRAIPGTDRDRPEFNCMVSVRSRGVEALPPPPHLRRPP